MPEEYTRPLQQKIVITHYEPELQDKIKKLAKARRMTISAFCLNTIEKAIKEGNIIS